MIFRAEREL